MTLAKFASSKMIGTGLAVTITLLAIAGVIAWFWRITPIPNQIIIASGIEDSQYASFSGKLRLHLLNHNISDVTVKHTEGSIENRDLLDRKEVQFALIQSDVIPNNPSPKRRVIAPLFPEFLHVIVRSDSNIHSFDQLEGKRVWLGAAESGMRRTAVGILDYYEVKTIDILEEEDFRSTKGRTAPLVDLVKSRESEIEAFFITTGAQNKTLHNLPQYGDFRFIEIPEAEAIANSSAHLFTATIPKGQYSGNPLLPAQDIKTIATTALLVVSEETPDELVRLALQAIHEDDMKLDFPTLIPPSEAIARAPVSLHPYAHAYFNPIDRIGALASVMESLAATKELLFALGAGLYLIFIRWRHLRENESQAVIDQKKERLDGYLNATLIIEKKQMGEHDIEKLKGHLNEVTSIKLKALKELTDEELRGDQVFSVFLMQCSALSTKLQQKIQYFSPKS